MLPYVVRMYDSMYANMTAMPKSRPSDVLQYKALLKEIQAMKENGCMPSFTIPVNFTSDLKIYGLTTDNSFARVKYSVMFSQYPDEILGNQWDVKILPKRGRFLQVTRVSIH